MLEVAPGRFDAWAAERVAVISSASIPEYHDPTAPPGSTGRPDVDSVEVRPTDTSKLFSAYCA